MTVGFYKTGNHGLPLQIHDVTFAGNLLLDFLAWPNGINAAVSDSNCFGRAVVGIQG